MKTTRNPSALLAVGLVALMSGLAPAQDADHASQDAERIKQLEGHFARIDKNRDATLRGDEVPDGWLERYDRNGDDKITKKEFGVVIRRPPMLRKLHMLRDARARARNSLVRFDRDKDGLVSIEEYPGDRNAFRKADRNKDDNLEWKELLSRADDELAELRQRRKRPSRNDFLNLFDVDYDRNVSVGEYDGPERLFKKYDTDGDGTVTYDELYPRGMMAAEAAKPEAEDMNVLTAMDTDDDGKISREEWKGTAGAWKRLDRNGDGWITVADAR